MPSNIKVSVTADVADLQAKLAVAKAEAQGFTKELNTLARQAVQAGGNLSGEFKVGLQTAAEAAVSAKANVAQLSAELKTSTISSSSFGSVMTEASAAAGAFGIAIPTASVVGLAAAIAGVLTVAEEYAETMRRGSEITGLSTGAFQAFIRAANVAGTDTGAATTALERLNVALGKANAGSYEQAAAFKELGVDTREPGETLIPKLAAALLNVDDAAEKSRLAMLIYGRSFAEILPALEGWRDVTNDGVKASKDAIDAVDGLARSLRTMKSDASAAATEGLGQTIIKMKELWTWASDHPWLKTGLEQFLLSLVAAVPALNLVMGAAGAIAGGGGPKPTGGGGPPPKISFGSHDAEIAALGQVDSKLSERLKLTNDLSVAENELLKAVQRGDAEGISLANKSISDIQAQISKLGQPDKSALRAIDQARKAADEISKINEEADLAHIQSEEASNSHLLQIGQQTSEQYVAQAEALEKRRLAIQLAAVHQREQQDAGNANALKKDQAEEETLVRASEDRITHLKEQANEKRIEAQKKQTAEFIEDAGAQLQFETQGLEQAYDLHFINDRQRHDLERQLTASVEQEVLKRKDAEIASLKEGTDAWKEAVRQRTQMEKRFATDLRSIDTQLTKTQEAQFGQAFSVVGESFNTAITSMAFHGQSFGAAMLQMASSIGEGFLQMDLKVVEDWAEGQLESLLFGKTAAVGKITDAAAIAAANAYAANAEFPPLAEAAASAAFFRTEAFTGYLSAERGLEAVPADGTLIKAHKGEAVLPAMVARPLMRFVGDLPAVTAAVRSSINNNNISVTNGGNRDAGFRGGNVTIQHNVNALDGKSVSNFYRRSDVRRAQKKELVHAIRSAGGGAGLTR